MKEIKVCLCINLPKHFGIKGRRLTGYNSLCSYNHSFEELRLGLLSNFDSIRETACLYTIIIKPSDISEREIPFKITYGQK